MERSETELEERSNFLHWMDLWKERIYLPTKCPDLLLQINLILWIPPKAKPFLLSLSGSRFPDVSGDGGNGMTQRIFLLPNLSCSYTSPHHALLCSQHRRLTVSSLGYSSWELSDPGLLTAAWSTASN